MRPSSSGTLSRFEARKAVLGVKKARSASAKKTAGTAKKASAWSLNRYLGHFGIASPSANSAAGRLAKKSAAKKSGAKKKVSTKKKPAAKKSSRAG